MKMTEPEYIGYTYVDLTSPEYQARFDSPEAITYSKTAMVRAWRLTEDTPVSTVLADGTRETDRVAPAGHWVVENPGGEQSAIEPEKFDARYDDTIEPGVFRAKGRIRAIANTTGDPVWINAPWREPQFGAADCRFACLVRADGSMDSGDAYIIGRAELDQTYEPEAAPAAEQAAAASAKYLDAGRASAHLAATIPPGPSGGRTTGGTSPRPASTLQPKNGVTSQR